MKFIQRLYKQIRLTIYSHLASEFHTHSEHNAADLKREVEALRKEFLEELHLTRSHFAGDLRIVHKDIHALDGKFGPSIRLKSPVPVEEKEAV